MKVIRVLPILAVVFLLSACPAKLRIQVENLSPTQIHVFYAIDSVDISSGESVTFSAFLGSQNIRIVADQTCREFNEPFSSLTGDYYKPGLTHTFFLAVDADYNLIIRPTDNSAVESLRVAGTVCDRAI